MKFSWQRIFVFGQYVSGFVNGQQAIPGWLERHPEDSKFRDAVKSVIDQVAGAQEVFQKKRARIEKTHCATMHARAGDPESPKIIVRDDKGGLTFTVEGDEKREEAINALIEVEDLEIEPYYVAEMVEIPKLNAQEIEIFKGFVLNSEQVGALKRWQDNGHIPESPIAVEATA